MLHAAAAAARSAASRLRKSGCVEDRAPRKIHVQRAVITRWNYFVALSKGDASREKK